MSPRRRPLTDVLYDRAKAAEAEVERLKAEMQRNAATPGPWFFDGMTLKTRAPMGRPESFRGWIVPLSEVDAYAAQWGDPVANKKLITSAPDLLAEVERLKAALKVADEGMAEVHASPLIDGSDLPRILAHARGVVRSALGLAAQGPQPAKVKP